MLLCRLGLVSWEVCAHCRCHGSDVPGKWLAMWLVATSVTGRAVVLTGSPHSDSTFFVSAQHRGSSGWLPSSYLISEPRSLLSSLGMRNTFHSQVERCGTEKHRLWNSNLSSLTLAVWPWAIYLNRPERNKWCLFPCRVDVGMKGGILDLPGTYWMVTSRTASVVGAGLGNSPWFSSALLSDLPWCGPGIPEQF